MKPKKFSISNRIHSFRFALNGLKILFKEEFNARIQLLVAIAVVIAGFIRGYSGFGFSMITVVSLSMVFRPVEVVPVVLLLQEGHQVLLQMF